MKWKEFVITNGENINACKVFDKKTQRKVWEMQAQIGK
jgi:hypothetical protein